MTTNDALKEYAPSILKELMTLLRTENEDNGVLCMKILTSFHRSYKTHIQDQVEPFLNLVIEIYKNIPQVVRETFAINAVPSSGNTPVTTFHSPRPLSPSMGADFSNEHASKPLQRCLYSFKVLTECPIIVVLLYSTHKHLVRTSLATFIPHIIEMLKLQAPPQANAHAAAASRGEIHTSISPQIKNRAAYGEFITAQVKSMSFLAYALRSFSSALKQYHSLIPDFVVRLLQDCPCELSAARKELLVATRHILSTDFRTIFIPKVDILLNERVLIGNGLTVHETLRPLAYSTIADLVHHVRAELTPEQIWKTVKVYCKNMQDDTLPTSFQIMSAKLLLNLVERIMKLPNKAEGRQIMVLILNAFVQRFATLNRTYDHVMKSHKAFLEKEKKTKEDMKRKYSTNLELSYDVPLTSADSTSTNVNHSTQNNKSESSNVKKEKESKKELDFFTVLKENTIQIHADQNPDELRDAKYLFKNLMNFLKTVMFGLKSCNPPPPADFNPQQWQESARMFNYEQIVIFRKLFREGILGHLFYAQSSPQELTKNGFDLSSSNLPNNSAKDETELMETFATVFIHIDPASFNEIVEAELPFLYEATFKNATLLYIPQFFLANESTSSNFAGLLISFLKKKLPELGAGDPIKSGILIRLFKLCFMGVNLFPMQNENILLPHLRSLIIGSLDLTTTAKEPIVYFHLLRTLFRSIGGGRFEQLYKEVLPLLQVLLASLNNLLTTARRPQERDIYVELCLTVPVRLSVLVPHLGYLMRPLVLALNGSAELVNQGLRTLELCVDNLTSEYFDPIMEPVVGEIMQALWKHLKPLPYNHQHSHTTFRILGKLGGRNRRYLTPPTDLKNISVLEQEASVLLNLDGINELQPLKLTPSITCALNVLEDHRITTHYRKEAYNYLSTVLKLFFNTAPAPEELADQIQSCVSIILGSDFPEIDKHLENDPSRDVNQKRLQNQLFERLLQAVFYATSIPEVKEEALELVKNLCEHCVLLEVGNFVIEKRRAVMPFNLDEHEGIAHLDPKSILSAIVYALCHYDNDVKETGKKSIHYIFEAGLAVIGSTDEVQKFPMFKTFFGKLSHTCFEAQYYRKAGACLGLKTLIQELGISLSWISDRQLEFVRTMFFVIKDIPNDVPSQVKFEAHDLLLYVLENCNKDISEAQMSQRAYKQLTGLLAYELANANAVVRKTSQEALQVLSKVTGKTVTQIILPVKNILLPPIFTKPLRALPFLMQIGHIDAITFCLGLKDTFLEFNDELNRLVLEALALIDAEDDSLTSAHRASEHRTAEQLVQLRIVSIKLLSLALTLPDYHLIQQTQTRSKIMAVFFKTLYNKSSKVVDAAHAGLRAVVAHNTRLPKDILQNGLRPILLTLSDHKRLKVSGLEGLARLLEVLTNYFKVEIGNKLLDHLNAWAEPEVLQQYSIKTLQGENHINIIVAILNVFHLLPSGAFIFMKGLMKTLLDLENRIRRQHNSPFREPIAKFVNRYPVESWNFFSSNFTDRTYGRIFSSLLAMDSCADFRKHIRENLTELTSKLTQEVEGREKCYLISNMIHVIDALMVDDKEWIKDQRDLLVDLKKLFPTFITTARNESNLSDVLLQTEQSIEKYQLILVSYLEQTDDTDLLLSVINVISSINIKVNSELHDFIFNNMVSSKDVQARRKYLLKSIDAGTTKSNHVDARGFVFKYIINATLIVEASRNENLLELLEKPLGNGKGETFLDVVHDKVWKNTGPDAHEDTYGTIDYFRFELLNVSALLLKHCPSLIADARKDIIKFGWSNIKLEDIVSKQAAYVLIAYFIAAYDTLSKMVVQIYVHLLKTHQNEAKILVRQGLDLLAPVLKERVSTPLWAKWPRRVLSEDGHNVSQVTNIYQFITRHPELFFEYRDHFVSNIIAAMPKLSLISNPPLENQNLAVDLADLILTWENMANESGANLPKSRKRKLSDVGDKETSSSTPAAADTETPGGEKTSEQPNQTAVANQYSVPFPQREACITYLIRFVCVSPQKVVDSVLGRKVIGILYHLLGENHWSEVTVKLAFFDKSLVNNDISNASGLTLCLNALQVICITLGRKPASWIVSNIHYLMYLLEKCIKSNNVEILDSLLNVLNIIFNAIKVESPHEDDDSSAVSEFLTLINNSIQENFTSNGSVSAGVMLSWALVRFRPSRIDDSLLQSIMKAFGKLYKDHTSPSPNGNKEDPNGDKNLADAKFTLKLLAMILDIASVRISHLNDQRRIFLSLYAQLIERSTDKDLCLRMIAIARNWVFSKTDLFPTTKEKAAILSKMMVFESRKDKDLTQKFYEILIDIYTNPSTARSDLAVRMEPSFMIGTRLENIEIRQRLMEILNNSLDSNALKRLNYVIADQNWEYIGESQWLNQALQILYGGMKPTGLTLSKRDFTTASLSEIMEAVPKTYKRDDGLIPESLHTFVERRIQFVQSISKITAQQLFKPLSEIQYKSPELVHKMWVNLFPLVSSAIPKKEKIDFLRAMVLLLSKDYHNRQMEVSPNVVQSLLEGASKHEQLPPHLVKYLGKSFNSWYPAIRNLETIYEKPLTDSLRTSQSNLDALAEMYAGLQEDDMFYGLWRRRAKYSETNTAVSYEQCGLWSRAMQMYESAQIKARSGALPYSEAEYALWEDHWILCAQKLQQWEILTELAKHESFTDLLLECGWRVADWTADKEPLEQSIKTVMDVPTPRRQIFETFLCLQGYAQKADTMQNLSKCCDEGIQLALRKWNSLPERLTGAHIPLLHTFQQYVEFMEASQVYTSLQNTNVRNLDTMSQELKGVLQAWRERLPNLWDDINIWGDLVTWRKHAFNVINSTYIPLIPALQREGNNNNNNSNSFAYRGYHEIAWIINRFAHVARKHSMTEVCLSQLHKIYSLPNIEIQEAFLKLREQAKCYYQNPNEYQTGLDVISNTNLIYFVSQQKAEFFTLKGMFLSKLNVDNEANHAFATAVQIDLYHPKAWAEWGYFIDRSFQKNPNDINQASIALNCYLQAAGLYKNGKTRKILGRILWLMSIEDDSGTIAKVFEKFHGEVPVWYWITYIPQLLTALSHKEGQFAKDILIRIAKSYPQSLHFHLRTTKEDFALIQRQAMSAQNAQRGQPGVPGGASATPSTSGTPAGVPSLGTPAIPNGGNSNAQGSAFSAGGKVLQPWDHVDEILNILKTAYPLLALSLEALVDQIYQRFKCTPEEDTYRLIMALLNESVQNMGRLHLHKDRPLPTEANIAKFAETVIPDYAKAAFEKDFVKEKPEFEVYVKRLRKWRDLYEERLDKRPGTINLEALSPHLSEFHYQKFEDIEVPGQYSELKDDNLHFVKIDRFMPTVDVVRGFGQSYKRIKILGHNGSIHMFAVQYPSGRQCRREERVTQLFKILNGILTHKKESRRRNLQFTLPVAVPFSPHIRIIQDNPQYVSMHAIYEDYCRRMGRSRDEPLEFSAKKMKAAYDPKLPKPDMANIKMEILNAIQATIVPSTVLRDYFERTYATFQDFWLFRKQFAYQYAGVTFMTFLMSISNRYPHKCFINAGSGNVWSTDMLPMLSPKNPPTFHNGELVPFRLTPNIQALMGPIALEGIYSVSVMVIAKCLTESEFDLDQYLSVFVRDELISWYVQQQRRSAPDKQLREIALTNVGVIVKRATSLAQVGQGNIPANQTVIDLISQAVNPRFMVHTDNLWMPYL